ncbi:hypothetical protein [Olivibacter sitiensis]|uniref:hypothetical protein n=1 Tax=Olivibacter sitiensis TaxID=376470 RepID=UPI0012F7CA47|nr:hypothetical protein [Olivibacter sitiensis]
MKKHSYITVCLIGALCACNDISRPQHANWSDSTFVNDNIEVKDTKESKSDFCFMDISGNQKKDTTRVHISLLGSKVMGNMEHLPFEKDKKVGTLEGKKTGDTLYLKWYYEQEGIKDSVNTVFLIQNNQLRQKPFSYDRETGKAYTAKEAKFLLSYKSVPCSF